MIEPEVRNINGTPVLITAAHQKYANGNEDNCIPPRNREWKEGPYEEGPGVQAELQTNARGIQGMSGALWDETSDSYTRDVNHPEAAVDPGTMAVRGGGWGSNALYCRSSSRRWVEAVVRSNGVGLRLVSPLP
jgi:formylglycine-generating enzyme required for sulfatase activity